MNKDMILGFLRHILTFGGGFLLAKGWFDQGTLDLVVPAVITLAGAIWSVVDKANAPPPAAPPA